MSEVALSVCMRVCMCGPNNASSVGEFGPNWLTWPFIGELSALGSVMIS